MFSLANANEPAVGALGQVAFEAIKVDKFVEGIEVRYSIETSDEGWSLIDRGDRFASPRLFGNFLMILHCLFSHEN